LWRRSIATSPPGPKWRLLVLGWLRIPRPGGS
jgi:hypothetical protein